jgi:glycerophosphoryl diester phosphodiesterase
VALSSFKHPLIIAHRGFRAKFPAAVQAGAHMLEMDVTFTQDKELVIIHDATVDRTTNGTGPVNSFSLRELQQLDAGSWFDPRFTGEQIPTLSEVLDDVDADDVLFNIEIKPVDFSAQAIMGEIERALVQIIDKRHLIPSVLITSFDTGVLKNIRRLDRRIPLGLNSKFSEGEDTVKRCRALNVFSYHPNFAYLNAEIIEMLHKNSIYVMPYNIETSKEIQQLQEWGADGVCVEDPQMAAECLMRFVQSSAV